MRLSYSKLEAYETCPRMFYYTYVANQELQEEDSFYTQYGRFVHELIDKANRGKIPYENLAKEYSDRYEKEITTTLDSPLEDSYFFSGYDYFSKFTGVIPGAEIIESEKKYIMNVDGTEFSGVIDMVAKLPDGRTAIIDHKSTASRYFRGKTAPSKYRQLYIYAEILKRKTGSYPDVLMFNCFREGVMPAQDFDPARHAEVMAWTNNMIRQINSDLESYSKSEGEWLAFPSFYWCKNICKHRIICPEVN